MDVVQFIKNFLSKAKENPVVKSAIDYGKGYISMPNQNTGKESQAYMAGQGVGMIPPSTPGIGVLGVPDDMIRMGLPLVAGGISAVKASKIAKMAKSMFEDYDTAVDIFKGQGGQIDDYMKAGDTIFDEARRQLKPGEVEEIMKMKKGGGTDELIRRTQELLKKEEMAKDIPRNVLKKLPPVEGGVSSYKSAENIIKDIAKPKEGLQGSVLTPSEQNVLSKYLNENGLDKNRGAIIGRANDTRVNGTRDVVFGTLKDGSTLVMSDSGAGKGMFRTIKSPIGIDFFDTTILGKVGEQPITKQAFKTAPSVVEGGVGGKGYMGDTSIDAIKNLLRKK